MTTVESLRAFAEKRWAYIVPFLVGLGVGYPMGGSSEPAPIPEPVPAPPPPVETEDTGVEEDEVEATAPSTPAVLLLTSPILGQHDSPHWFDHNWGPGEKGQQLVYLGRYIPGKSSHVAYDWKAKVGTPVLAAAAGVVHLARDVGPVQCADMGTVENALVIKLVHPSAEGLTYGTVYAHLSSILVKEGARVTPGQQIGHVGSSGCSTGPHLHFNVQVLTDPKRFIGYSVDPYGWSGIEPDPWPHKNVWLWKEAPLLTRRGQTID